MNSRVHGAEVVIYRHRKVKFIVRFYRERILRRHRGVAADSQPALRFGILTLQAEALLLFTLTVSVNSETLIPRHSALRDG
jgi:hypothetical protein